MKNMREKLFIATFSGGALETIKENKLNIEINHTCISETLDDENRSRLLGEIRSDILKSGAQRVLVHGPFTEIIPAAIDYKAREFALERLEQSCQVAAAVGAEAMIVHSGYIPFMYFKEWQAEKSAVFWQKFMSDKPADFRLYVENVLEDEPYMIADMMERIDDSRIGLCLDVGHALAAGHGAVPIEKWIEVLGPHIGHFHIHNNHGDGDTHSPLGDGILDFHSIFSAADAHCRPDVTFSIESRECAPSVRWLIDEGYLSIADEF